MSKGLEALKELKDCGQAYNKKEYNKRLATIEKELKEYESYRGFLDNVEKGIVTYTPRDTWEEERKKLKRLEELEKAFDALSKDDEKAKKLLSKEIEKNRALDIILKKKVNVYDEIYQTNDYEDYKENFGYTQAQFDLTEEEYNLIKGLL